MKKKYKRQKRKKKNLHSVIKDAQYMGRKAREDYEKAVKGKKGASGFKMLEFWF